MRRLVALLVALVTATLDRLRVRWYRWRRLPTVREQLAQGQLSTRPLLALRQPADGPLAADETTRDVLSIPSSLKLVKGEPLDVFLFSRLPPLPPAPQELATFRPAAWPLDKPTPRPDRLRPRPALERQIHLPAEPIGVARPELFGVDPQATSARPERQAPPPLARPELVPERPRPTAPPHLPAETIGVAHPERFGFDAQLRPPSEQLPSLRRHPPKLPRAQADFRARYAELIKAETLVKPIGTFFGEEVQDGVQGFFEGPAIGPTDDEFLWDVSSDIGEAQNEVREQYILRRDIDRPELEKHQLDDPYEAVEGFNFNGIQVFSGLEFESLEPEPFEPLKMRLAAPPVDHRPPLEDTQAQLAWLLGAIGDFPADKPGELFRLPDGPPPVPEIP